jgi:hypothetical protein
MGRIMHWQLGFKRIRLVGAGAIVLGFLLLVSVLLTRPMGLLLIVLGLLLWLAVWVLAGFLPADVQAENAAPPRAQFRD